METLGKYAETTIQDPDEFIENEVVDETLEAIGVVRVLLPLSHVGLKVAIQK